MKDFELSSDARFWLTMIGWTAGTIVLSYVLYRYWALMVGKAVAAELIKAGVVVLA